MLQGPFSYKEGKISTNWLSSPALVANYNFTSHASNIACFFTQFAAMTGVLLRCKKDELRSMKIYPEIRARSEDSDQPVRLHSLTKVFNFVFNV